MHYTFECTVYAFCIILEFQLMAGNVKSTVISFFTRIVQRVRETNCARRNVYLQKISIVNKQVKRGMDGSAEIEKERVHSLLI